MLMRQQKMDLLQQMPEKSRTFFKWFFALTEVYRPSGDLDGARQTIIGWADKLGIDHKVDEAGNVLFSIPATPGKENVPSMVLQGHLDIVAVGEFEEKGKVPLKIEGPNLTSGVSTIGADDGVSVATMFTMMETRGEFEHGPLEFLVTMDEEIGLVGASKLAGPPFIKSRTMLNLDTEEWGIIYTSCAGSLSINFEKDLKTDETYEGRPITVKLCDFVSGHTGICIHEGRVNAVKWMVRLLLEARRRGMEFRLCSISGGDKHNAIPNTCNCELYVKSEGFEDLLTELHNTFIKEVAKIETKNPKISFTQGTTVKPLTEDLSMNVINTISSIHHGVWEMHPEIEEMVRTSQSLSVITQENNHIHLQIYARTNEATVMDWLRNQNVALGELAGYQVVIPEEEIQGPWPAALGSRIMDVALDVYERLFHGKPIITGIHAGLECGCIQNRGYSDLEAIAIGPTVKGAHTVEECLEIQTAVDFFDFTLAIVEQWAK